MRAPTVSVLGVYRGLERIGEIEGHGLGGVHAWRGSGDTREFIGAFPTPRDAIAAVEQAGGRVSQARLDAKRLEIKLSYQRRFRRRREGNFRQSELRRLLRHRGKPEYEIDNIIVDLLSHDVWQWSPQQVGEVVKLTFDEQIKLGIRSFRCHDRPEAELRAHYAAKKRARDRQRKAQQRGAKPAGTRPLSARAEALRDALRGAGWVSAPDMVARSEAFRAFRNDRGRCLDAEARRQAVHRALKELREAGHIDTEKRVGERGLDVVFVRLDW
jgi:hypothetical protein